MSNDLLPVYVGYDSREDIAYKICEYSLYKHSPNVDVRPLKQHDLRKIGLYSRDEDTLGSTEFTFTRFLVPELQGFNGWALFCDCDFLWLGDIQEIFDQADDSYAVMVVKHDYTPEEGIKMDGCKQLPYPRKNWSSMILWNCNHPSNQKLNLDKVNNESGQYLHRFQWLKNDEIGSLDLKYNWLVDWYKSPKDGEPFALHYTEGGPWFEGYEHCDFSDVWNRYLVEYVKLCGPTKSFKQLTKITWVTSLSRDYFNYIGHETLHTWKNLPGNVVFVWDDKPLDLGFGETVMFWKDVVSPLDPWITEGLGGAKADRYWKKSRVQVWAARRYSGLVIWLDTDIQVLRPLTTTKAIELLHPGTHVWATLMPELPLDPETGIVGFNTSHGNFPQFINEYSKGWYDGTINTLKQPYDNFMIESLREKYPCVSYCPEHTDWPTTDKEMLKNVYAIHFSKLKDYFFHHIGKVNKSKKKKEE